MANQKRDDAERLARLHERATEAVLEDILPTLDAFDMAMSGDAWKAVDGTWRSGVEYIRTQLLSALEKHGVTSYGAPGDIFDATRYEAVGEHQGTDEEVATVQKVLRRGYVIAGRVIRPAQVVVHA